MGCPKKCQLNDDLIFGICTHDPDTGVLTDADSLPTFRVYENETVIPVAGGNMVKLDDANTTGFYTGLISCTQRNGFEVGKSYNIYIEATVNSDTGGMCYAFVVKQPDWYNSVIDGINIIDDKYYNIVGRVRRR